MKPFLEELAEEIFRNHPRELEMVTIVFPNRRAALYLQKYLSEKISKPAFAPTLLTIEDFIGSLTTLRIPDKIELIQVLYESYHEVIYRTTERNDTYEPEPYDEFYFWGEMLLRDFDEVDKYTVNADHLFKDLSHQKELDATFDYLTKEQQDFLVSFWSHFQENISLNKKRFLNIWRNLGAVYHNFRARLLANGLAYEGMQQRIVAENLSPESIEHRHFAGKQIKFAGFNALTSAEEKIIQYFVLHADASIAWDVDQYYVNNERQEAGKFFRDYQQHPVFKSTFPADIPANFSKKISEKKTIRLFGAAQPIGQVKLMSSMLHDELKHIDPEETLIVLPDEKLLTPVLHGVSGAVEKLNVTMGFPLANTPLFNLVELLAELQLTCKQEHFNHRQVLALLGHPYVVAADPVASNNKRKEILKHNWVHIPTNFLATEVALHRLIFVPFQDSAPENSNRIGANFISYVKNIIIGIGSLKSINDFDKEYVLYFLKLFNKLEAVLFNPSTTVSTKTKKNIQQALKSFLRLFRQLIRNQKIPFSGEPLKGLQVMGVLETRNLDYKNVFILSLNEGSFPAMSSKGSYIPFNIRKAYRLPTPEHHDAIYSYLFYRVLQRAENIFLFYNSETDVLGQGEMSRYLQQLVYESGIAIEKKILDNPIQPLGINPIVVHKNAAVLEDLVKLNDGNSYFQGISPSALNTYIECRLKFYFRHVAKIKEPNEVEEELDARVLGNFLHDVMERFYKSINQQKGNKLIEESDFLNHERKIDSLIDDVFVDAYRLDPNKEVSYEGQRLVVREVVRRFADRIIEFDRTYAPFVIEGLEQGGITYTLAIDVPPFKAVIGGKIDRVDRKDDIVRVIDYKTGKDKLSFDTISSLFARDENRNKAAFQTLLYALLYKRRFMNNGKALNYKVVPGLINRMNLFDEEFSFGLKLAGEQIGDVEPVLPEFEARLKEVFNELFNPEIPFDQTNDVLNCKNCPYGQICYRG
jgi:CRISPR/Cas system-associated exonuclease Cas4 (RecB family)